MQYYRIHLTGQCPLLMHNSQTRLDKHSPANQERDAIAKKRGRNRTEHDDKRLQELECQLSLWLDTCGRPTIPPNALRACLETAARKFKQGPQVREGVHVMAVEAFEYDTQLGTTAEALGRYAQFTTQVVVQRNRIPRTRAKFDEWAVTFTVEADEELVDQHQLEEWFTLAGRRIGLGDWRPEKSGDYGRFTVTEITPIKAPQNGFQGRARRGEARQGMEIREARQGMEIREERG